MKLIALESSGLVAGVAVLEDDTLLGEYTINYKKTHSQTLLPMLAEVKNMLELDLESLDAIAVSGGPGSFTGLRIGSATAKGLGLALDKPLIHVPTVDALACNLWGATDLICPLMDARRNQTYTGIYRFQEDQLITLEDQCVVELPEILKKVNDFCQPVIFLGDGVPVFQDQIKELLQVPYRFAPAPLNRQRAASVAYLGAQMYRRGETETAGAHRPDYLRLSQAERERQGKARDFTV